MTAAALLSLGLEAFAAIKRHVAAGRLMEDEISDEDIDGVIAELEAGQRDLREAIRRKREREAGGS